MMPNVFAVVGILGSTLLLVADVVLVYTPLPAKDFNVFRAALGKSQRGSSGVLCSVFSRFRLSSSASASST
jgi:hypothetical protein